MRSKSIIKELALIVSLCLGVILIFWFRSRVYPGNTALTMALNDTYFTIAGRLFLVPGSLVVIAIVYCIKEAFYAYKRKFQNVIFLLSILLINIYLLLAVKFFAVLFGLNCGRTVYPPLSALRDNHPPMSSFAFDDRLTLLLLIQIFFMVILVIIAVITGKNWHINERGNKIS